MTATHSVVTASRTSDGAAVYLTADRTWSRELSRACPRDEARLAAELAWARGQQAAVCDPYRLPVALADGVPVAVSTRERIRAAGPAATLAALGYGALASEGR